MKKLVMLVLSVMLVTVVSISNVLAEEGRVVGPITKIEMAADQKSAVVTVKDSKSGENVVITVTDDETLGKFKDKRIVIDDEIRSRFEKTDGKNQSKLFRKTAGC